MRVMWSHEYLRHHTSLTRSGGIYILHFRAAGRAAKERIRISITTMPLDYPLFLWKLLLPKNHWNCRYTLCHAYFPKNPAFVQWTLQLAQSCRQYSELHFHMWIDSQLQTVLKLCPFKCKIVFIFCTTQYSNGSHGNAINIIIGRGTFVH